MNNLVVLLGTYDAATKKIAGSPNATTSDGKPVEEPTPVPVALAPPNENGSVKSGAAGASQRLYCPPVADIREEKEKWKEKLKRLTMTSDAAEAEAKKKIKTAQLLQTLFRGPRTKEDTPSDNGGGGLLGDEEEEPLGLDEL
jgi:hypothetical protein